MLLFSRSYFVAFDLFFFVQVVIAGIEQKVGFVDYRTPPISSAMIIGLAVGICVPLLLILILLAVCRVRRSNRKRPPPAPSKSKIENTYIDSQSDHDNAHERMPLNYIQRNEEEREGSNFCVHIYLLFI